MGDSLDSTLKCQTPSQRMKKMRSKQSQADKEKEKDKDKQSHAAKRVNLSQADKEKENEKKKALWKMCVPIKLRKKEIGLGKWTVIKREKKRKEKNVMQKLEYTPSLRMSNMAEYLNAFVVIEDFFVLA